MVISDDKTQSVCTKLTSRIDKVKVYAAGATVIRIAELRLSAGEAPEQVEIAGLPLALDDSSVRVRVESERGTPAIATDLQVPLLAGSADVYVDGEYILSTNITTVPPKGQMELGLGVEQAIKVARNTAYQEARSHKSLVAFNKLRHLIKIDIANRLSREARIEVRERLPIPEENAKVEVQIDRVSPNWERYEQQERGKPIRGGYHWRVQVSAGVKTTLSVQYTVKTFVDSELIGGNRRE